MSILFCTGIQSGELKHGPLALVDETVPIIMIIMRDNVHSKCMNALQQVTARKGRPIIVCEQGDVVSYLKILSLISVNSKKVLVMFLLYFLHFLYFSGDTKVGR